MTPFSTSMVVFITVIVAMIIWHILSYFKKCNMSGSVKYISLAAIVVIGFSGSAASFVVSIAKL